jgi:hypothetical protein
MVNESSNNPVSPGLTETQRPQLAELLLVYGPEGPKHTKTAAACLRRLLNDERPGRMTNTKLRNQVRAILYECLCLMNDDGSIKSLNFNCMVHCPELDQERPIKQSYRTLLSKSKKGIVQIERIRMGGGRYTKSP